MTYINRINTYLLRHLLRWYIRTQLTGSVSWSIETTKGKGYIDISFRPTWGNEYDDWYQHIP